MGISIETKDSKVHVFQHVGRKVSDTTVDNRYSVIREFRSGKPGESSKIVVIQEDGTETEFLYTDVKKIDQFDSDRPKQTITLIKEVTNG